MKTEKKCRRCEVRKPLSKFDYNPIHPRRREKTCTSCHTAMKINPSKYAPKPKNGEDKPYDTATAKAIMAVPINVLKTQSAYMGHRYKQEQKEVRIR